MLQRTRVAVLLAGILALPVLHSPPAAAVDAFWDGASDFFDVDPRWSTGLAPGAADNAFFTAPGAYDVLWDSITGNGVVNLDLTVRIGMPTFRGADGPREYTITGLTRIGEGGALTLERMLLDTAGPVSIGDSDAGSLTLVNDAGLIAPGVTVWTDPGAATDSLFSVDSSTVLLGTGGPGVLENYGGNIVFANDAVLEGVGQAARLQVNGGTLVFGSGAVANNIQSITSQANFGGAPRDSTLLFTDAGTVINLTGQSPEWFTGLMVGFGGNSTGRVENGALVNIGQGGLPGVASGFVVGAGVPVEVGGPAPGASALIVSGPGSAINITGDDILGAVATTTPSVGFYNALGIPVVDNPPANGTLQVEDGGAVVLTATPGGYARMIVADTAGSFGEVRIDRGGSIEAGHFFGLGTDESETGTGNGLLEVGDGGVLRADRIVVGIAGDALVSGPGARLESDADGGAVVVKGRLELGGTGTVGMAGNNAVVLVDGELFSDGGRVEFAAPGSLTVNPGGTAVFLGNSIIDFASTDGGLNVIDGNLEISGGSRVQGARYMATQGTGVSNVLVAEAGTQIDLLAQSASGFTGLTVGFGGRTEMSVVGGAVINIGASGMPGVPSGLTVGADVPAIIGGPFGGESTLTVSGPGSRISVNGPDIVGAVGTSSTAVNFFEAAGVPGVDNPPGRGTLNITDSAEVVFTKAPGGSARFFVADTLDSIGIVNINTGGLLDAGDFFGLGTDLNGAEGQGTAELDIASGGTLAATRITIGKPARARVTGLDSALAVSADGAVNVHGTLTVTDNAAVAFAQTGTLNTNTGELVLDNATVAFSAPDSGLNVNGGTLDIRAGAQVNGAQFLATAVLDSQILVRGTGTVVNIDAQSPDAFTGLTLGFGGSSSMNVSDGAQVRIGQGGGAAPSSGFGIGLGFPAVLGGPIPGLSTLTVEGAGSLLHVEGDAVGGAVGSGTGIRAFFANQLGIPDLPNPGGDGILNVINGGQVLLLATPGGSSGLVVADSANASGEVHVHGGGALLDAGQRFAVGVDETDASAGVGLLRIGAGGRVQTGTLLVGAQSSVVLEGGTLAFVSLEAPPGNFQWLSGTLESNAPAFHIGSGGLLGNMYTTEQQRALTSTQSIVVDNGALLRLAADTLGAPRLVNNGEVEVLAPLSGSGVGVLENNGKLGGSGRVGATLENGAGGEVRVLSGQALAFNGSAASNAGAINLFGGTAEFGQGLANQAGGFIGGRGLLVTQGGLDNAGVLAFSGTSDILGDVHNQPGGQIIASGNSVLTFFDDVIHDGAEIRASSGSSVVIFGAFSGSGPLTGGGSFFLEGDLNPGNSPGLLQVTGDLLFGTLLDTTMELGGLARGSEYDAIDVSGQLTLSGVLDVVLFDLGSGLFTPQAGDSFDLFDAATIGGSFLAVNLPALQAGLRWELGLLESSGVLSVAAVPLPPAAWLFATALAGLGLRRRRTGTGAS